MPGSTTLYYVGSVQRLQNIARAIEVWNFTFPGCPHTLPNGTPGIFYRAAPGQLTGTTAAQYDHNTGRSPSVVP